MTFVRLYPAVLWLQRKDAFTQYKGEKIFFLSCSFMNHKMPVFEHVQLAAVHFNSELVGIHVLEIIIIFSGVFCIHIQSFEI